MTYDVIHSTMTYDVVHSTMTYDVVHSTMTCDVVLAMKIRNVSTISFVYSLLVIYIYIVIFHFCLSFFNQHC